MIFRVMVILSFSLLTILSLAQVHNIKFEHKGAETGLSHSNVLCILQDSRGFMWFGTRNGLNRYDGYDFTVYQNVPEDPSSLGSGRIGDLVEDSYGNIWIVTLTGGLDMFDWRREKFVHYTHNPKDENSISGNTLHSITLDHLGNLWIGTAGAGLCMLDRKTNKFIKYYHDDNNPNTISSNSVNDVLEDHNHNLWISTIADGLSLYNRTEKKFTHFRHDEKDKASLSSNNVEVIFQDSKRRIWIGTRHGLNLFNGKDFTHFNSIPGNANSLNSNVILSLAEDSEGNLWIGTENGGLSILSADTKTFYNYLQDDVDQLTLNNNSIWSLYKDFQGNMWLGTFSGGINFANREASKFTHYRHSSQPGSLSNNSIWAIFEDSKTNLWIGTDGGGLNLFDKTHNTFYAYTHDRSSKSISGNYVLSIAEDRHGNLWLGTWGNGITVFNKDKNTFKRHSYKADNPHGIGSPNVWTIYKDKSDKMWIGTYSNGIDIYDERTDTFEHFRENLNDSSSLGNNTVSYFYEDRNGTMWIATNGGLHRYNKEAKNFTRFYHNENKNSVSSDHIFCILGDAAGNLWIGTDNGLNYLETATGKFINYYTTHGLPDNTINGLLFDGVENLWISTNNGVSRFDKKQKSFKNFGISDGLQSTEFRKGALRSRSGKLYFGGAGGLNEFSPEQIKIDTYDPPLHLTGFEIFNKPVPIAAKSGKEAAISESITVLKEIELLYKHNVFSIKFASLNYTNPQRRKYAYTLEGFDEQWNFLSTEHGVTYTNLDPGTYTFKVKGMNNEGAWSNQVTELKIKIIPPYWYTWWFKTFSAILAIALAAFIFVKRTKNVRRINRELTEAVLAKTKEINAKNKILYLQREELAAQNEELLQSHEEISAQRDLVAKQNETLESEVNKRTQELVEYNHQLEQFAFISAHNLRAPVARILGLGHLLDISTSTDDERDQIYPRLVHATKELDGVVKDLNTILYLKKNSDSAITVIDLKLEVMMIVENLEAEIKLTQAIVTTDFTGVSSIRSVKPYLDSIIYNLISNAIKYRHPDRTPVVHIKAEKNEKEICLMFSDNGLGIDVNLFQDKLFTLYSRFHSHVEGKGMGLYLVKTQITAMGGRIEVESKVDTGTVFKVYFKI